MSKVITIPKDRNPFVVIVNGVKYSYPAGQTVEVPDSVADVIERYESTKPKPNAGGGSADLLTESGIIKQQHLPDGFPYREKKLKAFLKDAKPVFYEQIGYFVLPDKLNLEVGEEYTVTWNGAEYTSVCGIYPVDGTDWYGLGNPASGGGENNGMPFAIVAQLPENQEGAIVGVIVIPLDGSTDITLSITGLDNTIQKIDERYLPCDTVYIDGTIGDDYSISIDASHNKLLWLVKQGKHIILRITGVDGHIIHYSFTLRQSNTLYFGSSIILGGNVKVFTIVITGNGATYMRANITDAYIEEH